MTFRPGGTREQSARDSATNSTVPPGQIDLWGHQPATLWLANFQLSLRDEGTPRREQLELLQSAEKFGGKEGHALGESDERARI